MSSLEELELNGNKLDHISENAFNLLSKSDSTLFLYLQSNMLNSTSFAIDSFTQFNRPTIVYLSGNNITYLEQHIFEPFFKLHDENIIDYWNINCDDCRSYWAFSNFKYYNRVKDIKCRNGNMFTDAKNFVNCSTQKIKIY